MPQFAVHRNPNPATKAAFPLLLDVQNDLLSDLRTRVVVPLCVRSQKDGPSIETLTPVLTIAGRSYTMMTPQLAGVPAEVLGEQVANVASQRDLVIAALDFLVTGF